MDLDGALAGLDAEDHFVNDMRWVTWRDHFGDVV